MTMRSLMGKSSHRIDDGDHLKSLSNLLHRYCCRTTSSNFLRISKFSVCYLLQMKDTDRFSCVREDRLRITTAIINRILIMSIEQLIHETKTNLRNRNKTHNPSIWKSTMLCALQVDGKHFVRSQRFITSGRCTLKPFLHTAIASKCTAFCLIWHIYSYETCSCRSPLTITVTIRTLFVCGVHCTLFAVNDLSARKLPSSSRRIRFSTRLCCVFDVIASTCCFSPCSTFAAAI